MTDQADFFGESRNPCPGRSSDRCHYSAANVCRCRYNAGHPGRCVCHHCPKRFTPAPPSGPAATVPSKGQGSRAAWEAFRRTQEGQTFYHEAARSARSALRRDEKRWSPRTFLAGYRAQVHIRINDHFSPFLADDLIADEERLGAIIERRKRQPQSTPGG